jgi:hypothetical protein
VYPPNNAAVEAGASSSNTDFYKNGQVISLYGLNKSFSSYMLLSDSFLLRIKGQRKNQPITTVNDDFINTMSRHFSNLDIAQTHLNFSRTNSNSKEEKR